jgi:hypothetical protein
MTNPIINLAAIVGDKPIYKSLTVWGVAIFVVAEAASAHLCEVEILNVATCGTIATVLKYIGGILGVLGLRRAATAPNSG